MYSGVVFVYVLFVFTFFAIFDFRQGDRIGKRTHWRHFGGTSFEIGSG